MSLLRRFKFEIIIFILFILLAALFTWPLIINMRSQIYDYKGDLLEALWYAWWVKYAWQHDLSPQFVPIIASPFGVDLSKDITKNINLSFANYPLLILTVLVDEIFAYNFIIFLTFPLAGIAMYFLSYYLTKNKWASFLVGFAFSFCPYHFAHACHITLANIQWMPLFILFMFKFHNERTFSSAGLCGLFFALSLLSDTYYGYFMLIAALTFLAFKFFRKLFVKRETIFTPNVGISKNILLLSVCILVAVLVCFPYIYPIFKSYFFEGQLTPWLQRQMAERPISQLHIYAARVFNYILPAANHPFFGSFAQRLVGSIFYGENLQEHSLYLGISIILFSIFGYRYWNNQKKPIIKEAIKKEKDDFTLGFFVSLAIVAFLFSLPPKFIILNTNIYLPSYWVYKIAPFFRNGARFGIVVMLALCAMAGFGFKFLIERLSNNWKKMIVSFCLIIFLIFEFMNFPPFKTVDMSRIPQVYKWLKQQNNDIIVAEYPIGNDVEYLFYQRVHKKRLLNGAQPDTEAYSISEKVRDILKPEATEILKSLGVRYVILHLDRYEKSYRLAIEKQLDKFDKKLDLILIKDFGDIKVFKLEDSK